MRLFSGRMVYLPGHTQTQRKNQMVIPASSAGRSVLAGEDFYVANLCLKSES
ncbi:MAG: hypothetical protein WAK31_21620 [Chthoniobacterales bacterium]